MRFKVKLKIPSQQASSKEAMDLMKDEHEHCRLRLEALGFVDGAVVQYLRKISGTHILRQGQAVIALSEFEFSHLELHEWNGN